MPLSVIPQNATDSKAATAMSAAIAAATGLYSYCTSISITGGGATGASVITATLTGPGGGPLNISVPVPAGATGGIQPIALFFDPPLQSTATNTAITLAVPSFGAGNTNATCIITGYQAG